MTLATPAAGHTPPTRSQSPSPEGKQCCSVGNLLRMPRAEISSPRGRRKQLGGLRPPTYTPGAAAGRDWMALKEWESPASTCHSAPGRTGEIEAPVQLCPGLAL